MNEQIEGFLTDVMAFEREDSNAIRGGVRQRLAYYEKQFCAAETDKRMKGTAFRAFYALVRTRIVEEIKRCKGRNHPWLGLEPATNPSLLAGSLFSSNIISWCDKS